MASTSLNLTDAHLESMRLFFDGALPPTAAGLFYRDLLAHYYNLLIPEDARVLEIGSGAGELLSRLNARDVTGIDVSAGQVAVAQRRVPHGKFHIQAGEYLDLEEKFDAIIISDTLNYAADVQALFERLHHVSTPDTRLLLNFHSNLWRPLFWVGRAMGFSRPAPLSSWLTTEDVRNLLALTDWETMKTDPRLLCPLRLGPIARWLNRWIAPLLPWFCLTAFVVARPTRRQPRDRQLTASVVIPARNEAGNIQSAVERTPELGAGTELIFVEGHSSDQTWAEIQRVQEDFPERRIKCLQQSGKGKGNAVREGFAAATGDILFILDADLTMPPEELPKFYEIIVRGRAEFANGCRLVYPMESRAMQFLNLCANKTLGLLFTWMLGQPIKDTLCGTKVLRREHWDKIQRNRAYFGDFDPFGDFDMLFGADKLNLKIADVPIRYRERTYGTTNIQRWRHGLLLLRMMIFAARKLKFV